MVCKEQIFFFIRQFFVSLFLCYQLMPSINISSILLCTVFVVLILNTGGEGLKHSLHIPGVYFKRFLPVSNLVSLDYNFLL